MDAMPDRMTLSRTGKKIFRGKTGTAGMGFETARLGWFSGNVSTPADDSFRCHPHHRRRESFGADGS
jgi:beta-lactamase class D